jgi:hypothetical protein
MNPFALESPQQYALRKCNETISDKRAERAFYQGVLKQAVAQNSAAWIAEMKERLSQLRTTLNRLCARRSNLRKKLDSPRNG